MTPHGSAQGSPLLLLCGIQFGSARFPSKVGLIPFLGSRDEVFRTQARSLWSRKGQGVTRAGPSSTVVSVRCGSLCGGDSSVEQSTFPPILKLAHSHGDREAFPVSHPSLVSMVRTLPPR